MRAGTAGPVLLIFFKLFPVTSTRTRACDRIWAVYSRGGLSEHEEGHREKVSQDVLMKKTDIMTALSHGYRGHLRWCMVGLKGALPKSRVAGGITTNFHQQGLEIHPLYG